MGQEQLSMLRAPVSLVMPEGHDSQVLWPLRYLPIGHLHWVIELDPLLEMDPRGQVEQVWPSRKVLPGHLQPDILLEP